MDADDEAMALQQFLQEEMDLDEEASYVMFDSSSDEEMDVPKQWGGSRKGRAANKPRDFVGAYEKLMGDYFNGSDSVYSEADFERRFRMPRHVYDRIEAKHRTGYLCPEERLYWLAGYSPQGEASSLHEVHCVW